MSLDIISYNKAMQALRKAGFVGTKDVDETGLTDENVIYYSQELDKYISKELKVKVKEWKANTEYEKNEIVVFDNMMHWVLEDHTSHQSSIDFDLIDEKIIKLAATAGLANVLGLEYTVNEAQTEVTFTWTNPTDENYNERIGYISHSIDLSSLNYEECNQLFLNGEVEKIVSSAGTGAGNPDSVTHTISERNIYHFKIFVKIEVGAENMPSSGRYVMVENPDVTAPIATNDLSGVVEDNKATLTWTQPTDADFFYAKLVKSQSGEPQTPEDGTVLDTISGAGTFTDINMAKGVTYFYKVFFYDDAGNGFEYGVEGNWSASNGVSLIDVPVYGFDTNTGERTRDAVGLEQEVFDMHYPWSDIVRGVVDSAGNIVYYLDEDDSSLQEDGITPANLDGTDGNVIVEYPEFHYAFINGEMLLGHEEFEGSKMFNRTIVGAFEASEGDTTDLKSIASANPLVNKSITDYRTMSSNIGVGWHQRDMEFLEVLKILFAIEYGGLNSQQLIGEGIINASESVLTGSTIELGNKTGVASNGAISYRGLENPWGNTWEFIEGLYATDIAYYKAESGYDTFIGESNTGNYTSTGVMPITQSGFMSSFDGSLMVADEVLGNNMAFTGDYQYSHQEGQINIAVQGGNYSDGDKAGLFRLHFGLTPFGREEEMDLVTGEETYSVYERDITETELEAITNIVVE